MIQEARKVKLSCFNLPASVMGNLTTKYHCLTSVFVQVADFLLNDLTESETQKEMSK